LIPAFCFELFVRWPSQQLAGRQTTLFKETIQSGGRNGGTAGTGHQRQFPQQSHAGPMWVLAFQPLDQLGQLWGNDTWLSTIASRLGSQGGKATAAIAPGPVQQGVNRKRSALGVRDLVLARRDLLGPAREFAAGQDLQNQGSDECIAEQCDFFSSRIHDDHPQLGPP
jgi:hypothetical protein